MRGAATAMQMLYGRGGEQDNANEMPIPLSFLQQQAETMRRLSRFRSRCLASGACGFCVGLFGSEGLFLCAS